MAEAKLHELGGRHAYMDTDSIFVPPELAPEIVEYFQPLNPYALDISLLKEEKKDAWFFGISSKRYVLYDNFDGKIRLRDYKLHGLGHLTNPFSSEVDGRLVEDLDDLVCPHCGERPEIIIRLMHDAGHLLIGREGCYRYPSHPLIYKDTDKKWTLSPVYHKGERCTKCGEHFDLIFVVLP